jgi:hypothetical protein
MDAQKFLCPTAIAHGHALVTERFEESGNDFSNSFFVVDDQYFGFGHTSL